MESSIPKKAYIVAYKIQEGFLAVIFTSMQKLEKLKLLS